MKPQEQLIKERKRFELRKGRKETSIAELSRKAIQDDSQNKLNLKIIGNELITDRLTELEGGNREEQ